jgi:glycosyltransferase involved in cell wall biosynthesis
MRILEIVSGRDACGATVHTLQIARGLHQRRNELYLLGRPGAWVLQRAREAGIPLIESELRRLPLDDLRTIARFCHEHQIEVILAHMSRANNFAVWLSRLTGIPAVLRAHTHTLHFHWRMADHILAVSEQTRRYHMRFNRVPPHKISTVHGFIEPERLSLPDKNVRQQVRQELGLSPDAFVVGVVGNIIPRKGQLYLIRALPPVVREAPHLQVLLIGQVHPPRYGERVRREIARLGLEPHVRWLGVRSDVPRLLMAMDLYVLPTLNDMLPMALLEAMWMELPILSTQVGGIPEAVRNGIEGWLVPPRDPAALTEALREAIHNSQERARRARNAHLRIEEAFTASTKIPEIEAILKRVAAVRQSS